MLVFFSGHGKGRFFDPPRIRPEPKFLALGPYVTLLRGFGRFWGRIGLEKEVSASLSFIYVQWVFIRRAVPSVPGALVVTWVELTVRCDPGQPGALPVAYIQVACWWPFQVTERPPKKIVPLRWRGPVGGDHPPELPGDLAVTSLAPCCGSGAGRI